MRRLGAAMTVLAAAVVVTAGLAPGESATKPQLRVVSFAPFEVSGTGFRAGERVRVSVRTDVGTWSMTDAANGSGRVGARFRTVKFGECPDYVIAARGDKGSRAGLRSVPRPCGHVPSRAP